MPPKRPKIYEDSDGNRYVRAKNKRVYVPASISDKEFIKWLVKYLKPKRRKKKTKKATPKYVEPNNADTDVLSYTNHERRMQGLQQLTLGSSPGSVEFKKEDEPAPAPVLAIEEPVEEKTPKKKKKRPILKKTEMDVVSILDDANRTKEADRKREEAEVKHRAAEAKVESAVVGEAKRVRQLALNAAEHMLSKAALANMIGKLPDDQGRIAPSVAKQNKWNKGAMIGHLITNESKEFDDILEKQIAQLQSGSGAVDMEGLNGDQINDIMKPYGAHYLGTIARDGWAHLRPPVHSGKSGWIMNTDEMGKPGTHWVAMLIDLSDKSVEYYDSFGNDIPDDILVPLKALINRNNLSNGYLKLKVNRIVDQAATSDNCGWFCCKFLIDRMRGKSFRDVTKFDEHVKGEKEITAFKAKYQTIAPEYI